MNLPEIIEELEKWRNENHYGLSTTFKKGSITSDVTFALNMLLANLQSIANLLTDYTPYKKNNKQLARAYLDARYEVFKAINYSQEQRIEGPAKIIYIVDETPKNSRLEHRFLHPAEVFTGKCLAYDLGIYD